MVNNHRLFPAGWNTIRIDSIKKLPTSYLVRNGAFLVGITIISLEKPFYVEAVERLPTIAGRSIIASVLAVVLGLKEAECINEIKPENIDKIIGWEVFIRAEHIFDGGMWSVKITEFLPIGKESTRPTALKD